MTRAFPMALLTEAVSLQNRGEMAAAQAVYWRILLDDPVQFDALHLLGVSKCQLGLQEEGSWFIRRALEQRPDDVAALFNLGMALAELRRPREAIALFDRVVAGKPDHAEAWFNRGNAFQADARPEEAVASYRQALVVAPGMVGAMSNMGVALLAVGQAEAAIEMCRQALAGGADRTHALLNIARAQQELGQTEDSRAGFAEACAATPDAAMPRWHAAMGVLPDIARDEAEIAASRPAFMAAMDDLQRWYAADPDGRRDLLEIAWPFYLAYQARNNREPMRRFGYLRANLLDTWWRRQGFQAVAANREGPVRVAIVSQQLYSHSVWHAITRGWFAHLDPAAVALHGFHLGPKTDAETGFAREHAASFTVGERTLAEWVRAIQAVRPEVLIYPAVGMDNMSANLAALRLAPVQLASWGHPETTGLPTIDGYLSAEAFEPEGAEAAYSERLIRLPRLGVSYTPQLATPLAPDLAALGLDPDRLLILSPGAPFKYAPGDDGVYVDIARRAPGAQLVFFHAAKNSPLSHRLAARLAARFAADGLDFAAHVRFLPFQNMSAFYGLLRRADLVLDTIGFSGFNTAMQVLGQGTPLVGYEGGFMRGRLGSGILRGMGLDALVARDAGGFVDIVARLSENAVARDALRAAIPAALARVYDDRAAVLALQQALVAMAQDIRRA